MRQIIRELRERNVFKVAIIYIVAGWVLLQVADVLFAALNLPQWTVTLVAGLLIIGFPLAIILAWAFELTSQGLRRDTKAAPAAEAGQADEEPAGDEAWRAAKPAAAQTASSAKSVAVLPFADFSAERDSEYFADGLTEELINVLTKVGDLHVSSRTSCFAFKGKDVDVRTVAGQLGVAHVLEGSVRKAGNFLRITAQFIDAANDAHLWSETYDRELDDIFAIQDDIAQHIVRALRLTLMPTAVRDRTTDSVEAYDYYLRGRSFVHRLGSKNTRLAIDMFRKAVEVDENFARAWSGLAFGHATCALYYSGGDEDRARADQASATAVKLAPELGDTHTARGFSHHVNRRLEEAVEEFETAVRLDPDLFDAWYQYARMAYDEGDLEKAMRLFEKASEANPDDYQSPMLVAAIYRKLGRFDDEREAYKRGLVAAEKHLEEHPDNARAYVLSTVALQALGESAKANQFAQRALAIDPNDSGTLYNMACFYAQTGQPERALDCLEAGDHFSNWIRSDPDLDPLRELPRFKALLKVKI